MPRTVRRACFSLVVVAQIALFAVVADAQTKVACVGDSITADPNSWCVVLDQKLGSDYMVRNFGVSGTCALKGCDAPYWSTAQFKSSHDFGPDIVIIMLGTNDSKPSNWNRGKGQFAADYGALIDSYTSLATGPRVYAIIVIPAGKNDWAISGTTIANELNPIIKQVTMAKMITTIDGFAAFGGAMFDTSLFSASDQVHPYPKGHQVLGDAVYEVLMSSGGAARAIPAKRSQLGRAAAPSRPAPALRAIPKPKATAVAVRRRAAPRAAVRRSCCSRSSRSRPPDGAGRRYEATSSYASSGGLGRGLNSGSARASASLVPAK